MMSMSALRLIFRRGMTQSATCNLEAIPVFLCGGRILKNETLATVFL